MTALKRGRIAIKQSRKQRFNDIKITKKEFHIYMNAVIQSIAGGEEVLFNICYFMTNLFLWMNFRCLIL